LTGRGGKYGSEVRFQVPEAPIQEQFQILPRDKFCAYACGSQYMPGKDFEN